MGVVGFWKEENPRAGLACSVWAGGRHGIRGRTACVVGTPRVSRRVLAPPRPLRVLSNQIRYASLRSRAEEAAAKKGDADVRGCVGPDLSSLRAGSQFCPF
ncbi:hypothetical protein SEVIR_4G021033v4 [Setaria viridis]